MARLDRPAKGPILRWHICRTRSVPSYDANNPDKSRCDFMTVMVPDQVFVIPAQLQQYAKKVIHETPISTLSLAIGLRRV